MSKNIGSILSQAKLYIQATIVVGLFVLIHFFIHMQAIDELGSNYSVYSVVNWVMKNYWWLIVNLLIPISLLFFFKQYNCVKSYSETS